MSLPLPSPFKVANNFAGKRVFLFYLLVRLLQRRQVILFTLATGESFLFHNNGVYRADRTPSLHNLPIPEVGSHVFIWSLFEARTEEVALSAALGSIRFPVQVASPRPQCYSRWRKERGARLTGLPLWTPEELRRGYESSVRLRSALTIPSLDCAFNKASPR